MSYSKPKDNHPPPYTENTSDSLNPSLFANNLTAQLNCLHSHIHVNQTAHSTAQTARDLDITTLLIPEIESFLSDLGILSQPPVLAELILVPATAVSEFWILSDSIELLRRGNVVSLVRVEVKSSANADGISTGESWRRDKDKETEWWHNEEMARRLATYLTPKTEIKASLLTMRKIEREQRVRRSWIWKKLNRRGGTIAAAELLGPADQSIVMDVRAEDVTLRRENVFGIWESMNGWGIVVIVRLESR